VQSLLRNVSSHLQSPLQFFSYTRIKTARNSSSPYLRQSIPDRSMSSPSTTTTRPSHSKTAAVRWRGSNPWNLNTRFVNNSISAGLLIRFCSGNSCLNLGILRQATLGALGLPVQFTFLTFSWVNWITLRKWIKVCSSCCTGRDHSSQGSKGKNT